MQPSDFLLMIDEPAAALSDPELKQLAGAAPIFSVGAAPLAFSPDPRAEGERKIDGPAFVDRIAALANDRGSYFSNDGLPGSCIYPQQGGCDRTARKKSPSLKCARQVFAACNDVGFRRTRNLLPATTATITTAKDAAACLHISPTRR